MENQQAALLKTWVQVPNQSDFTIYNLPFGIFKNKRHSPRIGVAIGDKIVDLSALQEAGFFHDIKLADDIFLQASLNPLIALGKTTVKKVRDRVQQLLKEDNSDLKDHQSRGKIMVGLKEAEMMMPVNIGDFTAFLRPSEFLLPGSDSGAAGQTHPLGYQGKVSTIVPSGVPIYRPKGQLNIRESGTRELGTSKELDFELKIAFIVGKSTKMGESVSIADGEEYIFGLVLFNDWTARDIIAGGEGFYSPFSDKNFASSLSPWVLTLDALNSSRVACPPHGDELPSYLQSKGENGFDIKMEAYIMPDKGKETMVCRTNFRNAYWNAPQLLAQQTLNGSNIETGDLIAVGVVSNPSEGYYGSMVELNERPILLDDGTTREFIQDGDTVIFKGYCEKEGVRIGFGEINTKVLPSR
jgi:fumarylacetoacetase